ncbi:MAG: hydrogenase maturation protease [Candidatus Acidiferrales bacterium]
MNEWEWQLLEEKPSLEAVTIGSVQVKIGDRVRLHPRNGGDVLDIALAGKIATVECIEQDYEGQLHLAVVLDDDPGRDIGMMRQPGHRFFFGVTEVEPLPQDPVPAVVATKTPRILVAGIGNIFLGDDAFGVEVVKRFASRDLPEGVSVMDFGIRGFDLTYALVDGADVTILVDACPRGGAPGDLYIVEPDFASLDGAATPPAAVDAHGMNPMNVIRAALAMGGPLKKILLLGCEPQTFGPEEGQMGLSGPVAAAVNRAGPLLESVIGRILRGEWPSDQI